MNLNGVELDVDFTDADLIEKIEEGRLKVESEIKELQKNKNDLSPAEGIRQECKIVKDFIDYVFGDGTSEKIFGNKSSLKMCIEIFEDIFNERDKQLKSFNQKVSLYSPERLQRWTYW